MTKEANETAGAAPWPAQDPKALEGRRRRMRALIPASDQLLQDTSPEASRKLIGMLRSALRAERRRGQAGHWTYDLTRHLALRQAFAAEEEALARAERSLGRESVAALRRSDTEGAPTRAQ